METNVFICVIIRKATCGIERWPAVHGPPIGAIHNPGIHCKKFEWFTKRRHKSNVVKIPQGSRYYTDINLIGTKINHYMGQKKKKTIVTGL